MGSNSAIKKLRHTNPTPAQRKLRLNPTSNQQSRHRDQIPPVIFVNILIFLSINYQDELLNTVIIYLIVNKTSINVESVCFSAKVLRLVEILFLVNWMMLKVTSVFVAGIYL